MTVYPRRPENVLNCTDIYAYGVQMISEIPSPQVTGVWAGQFKVLVYNAIDPITYNWSVDSGIINLGQDEEICDIWVTGDHPIDINVTVTVTCPNGNSTIVVEFTTSVAIPKAVRIK